MRMLVLTDLDGTLLEPDASACDEARAALSRLAALGVPVCPVTSKTAAEVQRLRRDLPFAGPAGCENGAAVLNGDDVEMQAAAVPIASLRTVLARLRQRTGAPVRSLEELDDRELSARTGLTGDGLQTARMRTATLPLVVGEEWDARLQRALDAEPRTRLVRGNRFLHLQGDHAKADVVARLRALCDASQATVIALGDAPNDEEMLASADIRVIVPSSGGPNPVLLDRFPDALIAPAPHGRGWAAAVLETIQEVRA